MINKLGFGFLRLPKKGEELDWQTICSMADVFMEGGGVFFDTCYTYLDGLSEAAIRKCVVERKPRDSFQLCDKLPGYLFKSYEDCQKYFDEELSRCGVEWFDILMLHWLNDDNYAIAEKYDEFRFLREKKAEGKAKRIGFSYHGDAALLDRILTAHPEIDVVLIQLNYLDWESEGIQSRKCYETCLHHGKAVMVMEPFFAGQLLSAEPSPFGQALTHNQCLQYAIDRPGVLVAVPGVQTMEHLDQILKFLEAPEEEKDYSVIGSFTADTITGTCVYCNHCQPCPAGIDIGLVNKYYDLALAGDDIAANHYTKLATKADACLQCGHCEDRCPFGVKQMSRMVTIDEYFSK